jgi:hypothetical protein
VRKSIDIVLWCGLLQVQVRSDMHLVLCFSDAAARPMAHPDSFQGLLPLANADDDDVVGDTVGTDADECDRHTLSCSQHSLQKR